MRFDLIALFRSPLYEETPFLTPLEQFGSTFQHVASALRPYFIRSCFLSVILEVSTIGSALVAMHIIKEGVALHEILTLCLIYALNAFLIAVLAARNYSVLDSIEAKVRESLASVVSEKLYSVEDSVLRTFGTGKLKNLIDGDSMAVGQFFWSLFFGVIPVGTGLLLLAPSAILVGGKAILPALFISPLMTVVTLWSTRYQRPIEEKLKAKEDDLLESIDRWVQNTRLIRGMCWSSSLKGLIADQATAVTELEIRRDLIHGAVRTLSVSWWLVCTSVYLGTALLFGIQIELSGAFGSMWLLNNFATRLQFIPAVINNYSAAAVGMRRIDEFMAMPEEIATTALSSMPELESLVFKGVVVERDGKTILSIGDLTLPINQLTLIEGEVGSGKTTLLRLVTGEILPTQGDIVGIFSDGSESSLITPHGRKLLRSKVAYQPQEPFTAQARLSFNIALDDETSLSQMEEALRKSALLPDLAHHDHQDILLGEHGVNLSGGQKQRVTLARALHSRRQILVLDEPFSALDVTTQRLVARELASQSAVVVATHHPHLISRPAFSISLQNGSIAQRLRPQNEE